MRIRVEIAHSDGKDKLILIEPTEAIQQMVINKFFSYCRDTNVPVMITAQSRTATGG